MTFLRQDDGKGECIVLQADRDLYFPSVERYRNALTRLTYDLPIDRTIVLDMKRVSKVDYTSLKVNTNNCRFYSQVIDSVSNE